MLKNIFSRNLIKDLFSFKRKKKSDLLILDDIYPQPISAFRIAEYSSYLDFFNTIVLSTASSFSLVKEYRSFEEVRSQYYKKYPKHKNRIFFFNSKIKINAKLAYFIFVNNGIYFLDFIEKNKLPFVFTLYPGGGLKLYDKETNNSLKRIFDSPFFRKVIVTQKPVLDYIKQTNLLNNEDKIEFILGSPSNIDDKLDVINRKKYFSIDKEYLDICFVASKYSSQGVDKGYDTFIRVAHKINILHKNIRFHVVGGFDNMDIDVTNLGNNIKFYGFLQSYELHKFYAQMDVIISPNISNVLYKGSFDGFPLGCVLEAGICNVLMLVYDDLRQNIVFENNKNIIIVDSQEEIIGKILSFYDNPNTMYDIAMQGRLKAMDLGSFNNQIRPRINLIKIELQ